MGASAISMDTKNKTHHPVGALDFLGLSAVGNYELSVPFVAGWLAGKQLPNWATIFRSLVLVYGGV